MMKQLIEFDKENYTKEMNSLNSLVKGINKAMPILTEFEEVTIDMLQKLVNNAEYIQKERYMENLKKFSKQFGAQYDKLEYEKHSHIFKMARGATQYLEDAKKLIDNLSYNERYLFSESLIFLDEKTVKIAPNAEEKIRAKNTYYTKNKAEEKLLEKINSVIELLNEIETEFGGNLERSYYYSPTVNNLFYFSASEKKFKIRRNNLVHTANKIR